MLSKAAKSFNILISSLTQFYIILMMQQNYFYRSVYN